ncbi:hypothetical protein [Streptomyces pseudovenezuelae]|uniref:C2H2-type domain-containing protein n=1 Tax=Streptomyces pseudovenezuelae TaxID=67350 RepID=A0ABT6LWB4_9ACTN|nr:hypothetical protein [Streptomyces pseudovenezuelae]MDH6220513.1 hypothetical protein [Streptomyces pseudovenezuelae]
MSEISGQNGGRGAATAVVHESYSFACMRCGHGWEQSYEIEHHKDAEGHQFVTYVAGGRVVPSPLSRPSCVQCDGHVVRIMRPGQVSSVRDAAHRPQRTSVAAPVAESGVPEVPAQDRGERHHWHLSDLLHPFQRKAS